MKARRRFTCVASQQPTVSHLDSYGVVVANISGTYSEPYRKMLNRRSLNVPNVVLTDGDPHRRDDFVLAGLMRAARLVHSETGAQRLVNMVKDLVKIGESADTTAARIMAAEYDIVVTPDCSWIGCCCRSSLLRRSTSRPKPRIP